MSFKSVTLMSSLEEAEWGGNFFPYGSLYYKPEEFKVLHGFDTGVLWKCCIVFWQKQQQQQQQRWSFELCFLLIFRRVRSQPGREQLRQDRSFMAADYQSHALSVGKVSFFQGAFRKGVKIRFSIPGEYIMLGGQNYSACCLWNISKSVKKLMHNL